MSASKLRDNIVMKYIVTQIGFSNDEYFKLKINVVYSEETIIYSLPYLFNTKY